MTTGPRVKTEHVTSKSVRFPADMWRKLGLKAKARGVSRQVLLREIAERFFEGRVVVKSRTPRR